jgi:hypothetical protein
LRYLEAKREETGIDVTFTHLAIKASAVSILETPTLNGHMLFGYFYRSQTPGTLIDDILKITLLILEYSLSARLIR